MGNSNSETRNMNFSSLIPASLTSKPLETRTRLLSKTKQHTLKNSRMLIQHQRTLTIQEQHLLSQLRKLISQGETYKASLVATQIATIRKSNERNFAANVKINTLVDVMVSDNKTSRAEVEAIKSVNYANKVTQLSQIMARDQKYTRIMHSNTSIETLLNDGMDEIYADAEKDRCESSVTNVEIESILCEAFDGKKEAISRSFGGVVAESNKINLVLSPLHSDDSVFGKDGDDFVLAIETFDISIDMLKRIIAREFKTKKQFNVGLVNEGLYNVFRDGKMSLRECGIDASQVVCLETVPERK